MMLTLIKRFLVTEDFFEFNIKFLFLTGLWPDENLTRLQLKLYKIYENTLNIFMIIFLIITGISTAHCTDLTKLISQIDKSIAPYNIFFKCICFTIRHEQIKLLINDIIISGDKVTDRARDNMIKLTVSLSLVSSFFLTGFVLTVFVNNEMSIEAWMPFDPNKSKMNQLAATQIPLVLYITSFMYRSLSMQGMVCSLLLYLCDQLEDLQKRIRRLKYTKVNEKPMRDELKEIVRKHIRLVRYANSMETMFKEYFLIQSLFFTLEICIYAVLVATGSKGKIDVFVVFFAYLGYAILNAFIYCSLGNDIILQSLGIAQAAYDSEWTSWPVELQKTVLLVITVAQRPLKMSAGGFVLVDIKTFGSALYNGYSIFTVLNDVVK